MGLSEIITQYWHVATAFVGIVVTFVRMEGAIKSLKKLDDRQQIEIDRIREDLKDNSAEFSNIQVELAKINTTLEFIRDKIDNE